MSKHEEVEVERRYKGAQIEKSEVNDGEMQLINKHSIEPLSAEEVFTFKAVLCDNNIDRHFEAFNENSLKQMASFFNGRTFIKDHGWKADNQVARVYSAEVTAPGGMSTTGEAYMQLVAKCYMVKTDSNADLIAEIKAGIKKEVSIGFRLGAAVCSVCGTDNMKTWCDHWGGREYDGALCYFTLTEVTDGYEASFVAVPAQPAAGATKNYAGKADEVKEGEEEVEKVEESENPPPDEKAKEVNTRVRLMGAFLFSERGKDEQENA